MQFDVLGPLRVRDGGHPIDIGPREQQRLLALLLAEPAGLSTDRLVDELAGDTPPPSARHLIEVYVSRLRRALGSLDGGSRILRDGPRYVLTVRSGELDAAESAERLATARALLVTDPGAARDLLVSIERWWRGEPYEGLADDSPLLQAEVARLERHHELVVTDRIAADLMLGRHAELIGELEQLTTRHPFVEPLWHHRMLALYRSGRAAEALLVGQELRRLLADEMRVEPSPEVRRLERRIATQDPELAWSPPPPPSNLPVPTTSFVGRESELADVVALIGSSRLVTLTGPGGIGKTRLAIEAASRLRSDFPDGTWWVDLATVTEPEVVAETIASSLGIVTIAGSLPVDSIVRALAGRRALLVVDNCEHLAPVVAQLVGRVLTGAPGVHVLVTSRAPLRLSAEARWPVPGMSLTETDEGPLPDAVRLFSARAGNGLRPFELSHADESLAVDLCRRLDGIPLAIEMAARRSNVLTIAQIIQHIDDRFTLLRRSEHDVPQRHQTLVAALDWSYSQLPPDLQNVLDRIGVIVDGFDLAAASVVAGLAGDELAVAEALEALVDVSLVTIERRFGEPRFRLLETVREYAVRHLVERDELASTLAAHAGHYLGLVAAAGEHVKTPGFAAIAARISAAYPDVRQALAWSLVNEPRARTLRAARGLFGYWFWTGDPHEADRWSRLMLQGSADAPDRLQGDTYLCADFACDLLLRPLEGIEHTERALQLFRASGDHRGEAIACFGRGSLALQLGDVDGVLRTCREGLDVCEAHGERWLRAGLLSLMAIVYTDLPGHLEAARAAAEEAMALHSELGDIAGQVVLSPLAGIAMMSGDLELGERYAREMIAVASGSGWETVGRSWLVLVLTASDNLDEAASEARRALQSAVERGIGNWIPIALRNSARLAARRGEFERAALLFGGAHRNMPPFGFGPPLDAEIERSCRAGLGDHRFEMFRAQGAAMTDAELVGLALADDAPDLREHASG